MITTHKPINIPEMEASDIATMFQYIGPNHPRMLEWGSGGSTHLFSPFCERFVSIEHYEEWYNFTLTKNLPEHVEYMLVPNNKPRSQDDTPKEDFLDYVNAIDLFSGEKFDVILVDGRARKYCAEKAVDFLAEDGVIIIHDWGRPRYKKYVSKFLEVIHESDTIGILKPKA
tara:strand:- start:846 stop:1358 length:513 start_codon:yes stop_codon:yes gene_type:complete